MKELTIEIKGIIGSGKTMVAALIARALTQIIPDCAIIALEEGHRANEYFSEAVARIPLTPKEAWHPYKIKLITTTLPSELDHPKRRATDK